MIEIKNSQLTATINPMGAELQSLQTNHNQHELIWQRDPNIWGGSAPILFPIVGKLFNDTYTLNGQTYSMPKHGLVRKQVWDVVECNGPHAEFEIKDSDATRDSYPFQWKLSVVFELEEHQLTVRYTVTNLDEKTLYFSIGSHPAFNLNFGSDIVADYIIRTDNTGKPWKRHKILEQGLSRESFDVAWQGQDLALSKTIFDEDALVFVNTGCKELNLYHKNDPRQIQFSTGNAPDLGIWAKPGAPYVCLEPWYGYDDFEDHDLEFSRKPGIQTLGSHEVFRTGYVISLNPAWFG